MRDNTKKKALLSVNPIFNCKFLENNLFSRQYSINYALIGRNSQQTTIKVVDYAYQKSEPAVA